MEWEIWPTRNITVPYFKAYFNILNHLGITHKSDRQTGEQTLPQQISHKLI